MKIGPGEIVRCAPIAQLNRMSWCEVAAGHLDLLYPPSLPEEAERKRERLTALEARVLTGKAKPAERREYQTLRAEVESSRR